MNKYYVVSFDWLYHDGLDEPVGVFQDYDLMVKKYPDIRDANVAAPARKQFKAGYVWHVVEMLTEEEEEASAFTSVMECEPYE